MKSRAYRPGPPPGAPPPRFVARAYDRLASRYDRDRRRGRWASLWSFMPGRLFMKRVLAGGRVLDLGCGAGYPIARGLADRGFRVTGLDVSRAMLARARRAVPEGTFLLRDMARPGLPPASFDGAVAMYSLFHVSWRSQPRVFRAVRRLLKPGAPFLFNLGIEADREYTDSYFDTRMYWSSLPDRDNVRMLRLAGFRPAWHEPRRIGGECHLYYVAIAR